MLLRQCRIKLGKDGGTLTVVLILKGAPTQDNEGTSNKKYVDDIAAGKADVVVNNRLTDEVDCQLSTHNLLTGLMQIEVAAGNCAIDNSDLLARPGGTILEH